MRTLYSKFYGWALFCGLFTNEFFLGYIAIFGLLMGAIVLVATPETGE